jgi:hypothetical protein
MDTGGGDSPRYASLRARPGGEGSFDRSGDVPSCRGRPVILMVVSYGPRAIDRLVARSILEAEVPDVSDDSERVDAVVEFVAARIEGSPTVMRLGVRVIGSVLAVAVALTRRARPDAPSPSRAAAVRKWLRLPLPGVTEYARLVRSLALVGWYEYEGHKL